jgi:hypothetical protein
MDFIICLEIIVHIHACGNSKVKKTWIPEHLPLFYFIIFFEKKYFFKGYLFCCSPHFYLLAKLKQGWDRIV